jgi:2-polyprenyl-3-methyl-5-hydroxy-6-metoxy-1,4-benzoquinol methylase
MKNCATGFKINWEQNWPEEGLETLTQCPVCGSQDRKLLHDNLVDNVFFSAPGKWWLWTCIQCSSAYLDPRPSEQFIHLAYSNYYTHDEECTKASYASLGGFRRLRRRLVNGYVKWRFGSGESPTSRWGVLAVLATPPYRRRLEREYRHLPLPPSETARLLDVGCGSGSFLQLAESCGWRATGIDPDEKAVAAAVAKSHEAFCGDIDLLEGNEDVFDVITLNHVLEHLHDPVCVLGKCRRLLKPGGQLWLEFPRIDSRGHRRFGKNWRGLECPRHLVFFSVPAILRVLKSLGFVKILQRSRPSAIPSLFQASIAMESNSSPYAKQRLTLALKLQLLASRLTEALGVGGKELVTITCTKPENTDKGAAR